MQIFKLHEFATAMKVKVAQLCPTLRPHGLYSPWNSLGQNTGVGSLSLLQGIFPIQGSNRCLLHCRWILYQLSHKGSSSILEWTAYPFSSESSWPRNRAEVSCIAGRFSTSWATGEAQVFYSYCMKHGTQWLLCLNRLDSLREVPRIYSVLTNGGLQCYLCSRLSVW